MKNPKQIKYENESKSKVLIDKIFCGYHHCFAISSSGDIYGWGNPRNFRLTQEYGEIIPKNPKILSINWKTERLNEAREGEKDDGNEKPQMDERHIISLVKSKKNISIKEIFVIMSLIQFIVENIDKKYEDKRLTQYDVSFQTDFMILLKSIVDLNNNTIRELYMSVVRLQIMRIRQLGAPKKIRGKTDIPNIIKNNFSEIERVFTLFYLHPCYYLDLVEGISAEELNDFINGIKHLYKEINQYNKKAESLDNMLFISTFRILLEIDLNNFKDLDNMFMEQKSLSELMLGLYFYNVYP